MARYPFKERADEFMETRRGCISDTSWDAQQRRYRRMERELILLNQMGLVKTLSPQKMDVDDVKTYIIHRKEKKISRSNLSHDITALNQLLLFCGNTAVELCLQKNVGLKPVSKQTRLDPLPEQTFEKIFRRWNEIDQSDFSQVRPVAMVLMYIGTGARNKELRLAKITDVNTNDWTIHFEHVKGEDTYGHARTVPIPMQIRPIVEQYLLVRQVWLMCHKLTSEYLFFQMGGECDCLSGNTIRTLKKHVEDAIGERFELRDCRRAFGQFYLNKGLELEEVSVLMGHDSTRTTEQYYCRISETEVIRKAKELW